MESRLGLPRRAEDGVGEELTFSAQGDRLALRSEKIGVLVCTLATGRWQEAGTGWVLGFARSGVVLDPVPDPRAEGPALVSATGSRRTLVPRAEGSILGESALSASGERLATKLESVSTGEVTVVVRTVDDGEVLRRIAIARERTVRWLALSAEGTRLAVAYNDGLVEVWAVP